MDFSSAVKWAIRIVTAASIIAILIALLSAITVPATPVGNALTGFETIIGVFYYFVPSATVLFPLIISMWGLSFLVFVTDWGLMALKTVWRTSA